MDKFVEIELSPGSSIVGYWHQKFNVDGGYTVYVDKSGGVTIKYNNYGFGYSEINLSHIDLDGLINLLAESKNRIEQIKVVEKLSGKTK